MYGSEKNIRLFCYLTPEQKGLLKCPKLVFASPYGSGKTLLQSAKARELSKNGDKVLFLIFMNSEAFPSKA